MATTVALDYYPVSADADADVAQTAESYRVQAEVLGAFAGGDRLCVRFSGDEISLERLLAQEGWIGSIEELDKFLV